MTIDGRIDTEAEHMLMVRGHDSRCNDRAVGDLVLLSKVVGHGRQDACGADLVENRCVLSKVEGKNVFVVANRDDGLEHEDSASGNHRVSSPEVGMFPEDTVVLLMAADDVGELQWLSGLGIVPRIEVFNRSYYPNALIQSHRPRIGKSHLGSHTRA